MTSDQGMSGTNLAGMADARFFPNINSASLQRALHVHPLQHPKMTEILLKGT